MSAHTAGLLHMLPTCVRHTVIEQGDLQSMSGHLPPTVLDGQCSTVASASAPTSQFRKPIRARHCKHVKCLLLWYNFNRSGLCRQIEIKFSN